MQEQKPDNFDKNLTINQVGGKAFNLIRLVKSGFQVPHFVVITVEEIDEYFQTSSVESQQFIEQLASDFNPKSRLAVRSSCVAEDGAAHSFAGLFETRLFVPSTDLKEAILEIAQSIHSPRVTEYLAQKSITDMVRMAVVVQEMVESEVSGVAFGINPLTEDPDIKVINSVFGQGEGLVSGQFDADQFEVHKGRIISRKLAFKTHQLVWDKANGFGTVSEEVESKKVNEPSLNPKQIAEIERVLDRLQLHFGSPQDIEFAWKSGQLFLLQTRPITTLSKTETGPHIFWDNSNIVESYPGVTLPLTFSFITKMYEAVYRQLSGVMGISNRKIEENKDLYANMLGLLKGRIYYNLNSWYGSLALLPGYALNAPFMEKMMGVKESFPVSNPVKKRGWTDYLEVVSAVLGILKNLVFAERERKKFQTYFQSVMMEYESIPLQTQTTTELVKLYERFEQTLVKKWKAPLVNDFFAMLFFGLLQKQTEKWAPGKNLQNDLLIGSHDIITTQPAEWTLKISKQIEEQLESKFLFESQSAEEIWNELERGIFPPIKTEIDQYLHAWGDRSVGELKLETITFRQKPQDFIQVLKNFITQGIGTLPDKKFGQNTRKEAEKQIDIALSGKLISKIMFRYTLNKARYFVSNRENLRYERTRGFGMVRRIFLALGENLAQQKLLSAGRDIFYLSQEEVFQGIEGKSINGNWKELVQLRKKEYADYEKITLPERIETKGPVQRQMANFRSSKIEFDASESVDLQGLGCCAGVVTARIQVVHHPSEIQSLKGNVLVTSSTDPGWVTLFSSCAGILVERGSLLSHSAIVSREMGIPCIVGIRNLLHSVETGWLVEMDGAKGTIKILDKTLT